MILKQITILLMLLLAVACTKSNTETPATTTPEVPSPGDKSAKEQFMDLKDYGIYKDNKIVFVFVKVLHEISFIPSINSFRIQNDNQSSLAQFTLSDAPKLNTLITTRLTSRGITNLNNQDFATEVVKVATDTAWLWNQSENYGIIVMRE